MVAQVKNELIDPSLLLSEDSEEAQKTKKSSLQSFTDVRRVNAWQLARWPLQKNVTWDRLQIHLPRSYLAKDGEDVRTINMGSDINQFVHRYYLETVDLKGSDWVNFVHVDKVVSKRHEFLGPDPRVAGYYYDDRGEVHIRWWDDFLRDQWIGSQKWKVNVRWDGSQWVEHFT